MDSFERRDIAVVEHESGAAVIRVAGELDYLNSAYLEAEIERVRDGTERPIVVDLTTCRYIDSSVLSVLVRARKTLGGNLRLAIPPNSHIRRIFDITDLSRTLRIEDSVADALT